MIEHSVLIVEDDRAVRNLIAAALQMNAYRYEAAEDGQSAVERARARELDAVLLDLGLPDMDGVRVIEAIRQFSTVPIIVVSARGEGAEKIAALDAGADDYLTKPFPVDELLARLRAAVRRAGFVQSGREERQFVNGDLAIDTAQQTVKVAGRRVHLTPSEYKILCLLSRNAGKVLTHNAIIREVWGEGQLNDLSTLRVFMATLRKKIELHGTGQRLIQTHIGVGYRMVRVDDGNAEN